MNNWRYKAFGVISGKEKDDLINTLWRTNDCELLYIRAFVWAQSGNDWEFYAVLNRYGDSPNDCSLLLPANVLFESAHMVDFTGVE